MTRIPQSVNMAEVVGVVTGAAGLVSLSIQLLESARRLEQLCANFRGESHKRKLASARISRRSDPI